MSKFCAICCLRICPLHVLCRSRDSRKKNEKAPRCVRFVLRCTDTSASRHFGTGAEVSVGQFGTSAEVSGHFGTDHRGSHACQRRQLRTGSGRGGELKAVDVYVPLSLNCEF